MQFNRIALLFKYEDFISIYEKLPQFTYRQYRQNSINKGNILIVYELQHDIKSQAQLLWVANIKEYMKYTIKVKFDFVEVDEIKAMECSNIKYTLQKLQSYFNQIEIKYPKVIYPFYKDELYRNLCLYAKSLYYYRLLSIEMVMYTAYKMNYKLGNPYTHKELFKKVYGAYILIINSQEELKQKLTRQDLKLALKKGGVIRGQQMKQQHHYHLEQVQKLIKNREFIKPNGKVNVTAIANEIGLRRETISRILKNVSMLLFPFFFLWLQFQSLNIHSKKTVYHNVIAKVTLLKKYPLTIGFREVENC